jgi:SAM-dependent methyltransferase
MTPLALAPIEPLRSWPDGRYQDELVVVTADRADGLAGDASGRPAGGLAFGAPGGLAVSQRTDGRIAVRHWPRPCYLDDELAAPLAAALAPLTDDHEVFKRAFTGIVLTSQPNAEQAWDLFYRNSLAGIRRGAPGYAAIYRHAADLLTGPQVADLGCGFGLLALHLAGRGTAMTACDIEPGMAELLHRAVSRGAGSVDVLSCDARAVPLPDGSVDGVALLHVLEHVDEPAAAGLLREAVRLARSRVVAAVPYEQHPTRLFGHARSITAGQLNEIGAATGWRYRVYEHHGGWLVLDRPSGALPPSRADDGKGRTASPHPQWRRKRRFR